jgi:hypothetical protein
MTSMLHYNAMEDTIVEADPETSSFPLIALSRHEHHNENGSFRNGIQFAWDSTSIGVFKTCPRKYWYEIIKGYQAKIMPPALAFGIAIHLMFQTWHQLLAAGMGKETALLNCVRLAGLMGEKLPMADTSRRKEQLIRATVWYLDQFWDDQAETVMLSNGKAAVEYSFTLPLFEWKDTDGNPMEVYLCGHIDRFVKMGDRVLAADYKTSKYPLDQKFFNNFKPNTQFPIYVVASHLIAAETQELPSTDGILLDGIQVGVNYNRYNRHIIPFSPEEINEYIEGLQYWISKGMEACETGIFPMNEESCGKYGGCHFREICNKQPARREAYLKGTYIQRTWDPLKSR